MWLPNNIGIEIKKKIYKLKGEVSVSGFLQALKNVHGLLYRLQDKQEVASQHRMIKINNDTYEWLRKIRVSQIHMIV